MLKVYERGDHKGGFIGIRVAVMVDKKLIQKYFSYKIYDKPKDELYKEASQYHSDLLLQKSLASSRNEKEAKEIRRTTSPYSTGVKGIKFTLSHRQCYFYVQGSTNKVLFYKHFNIQTLGYDMAWFKACEFLQKQKDYSIFDLIYSRKPQKEMLLIAFRHLYFATNKKVHLDSIIPVIEKSVLHNWLKQLLLQYKSNMLFKEQVMAYLTNNNIYDKELLELI